MRRAFLPILALAAFSLHGCGGSGGDDPNPFRGDYNVTFVDPDDSSTQGTGVVLIRNDGVATGQIQSVSLGAGALSGKITEGGDVNGTVTYELGSVNLTGLVTRESNGFSGTLNQQVQSGTALVRVTATRR